jgi:hypothetical protein
MMDLIERVLHEFTEVTVPGRYAVDTIPWREYAYRLGPVPMSSLLIDARRRSSQASPCVASWNGVQEDGDADARDADAGEE